MKYKYTYTINYSDFQRTLQAGDVVRLLRDGTQVFIEEIFDLEADHNYSNLQDEADEAARQELVELHDEPEDALDDEYLQSCFPYGTPGICRMAKVKRALDNSGRWWGKRVMYVELNELFPVQDND